MATATVVDPAEVLAPPVIDNEALYEVVNGRYVKLPPRSTKAVRIACLLGTELELFDKAKQLGQAVTGMHFGLNPKLWRRPDVAFVSYQRWPAEQELPDTDPWPVVPDLAVEVVSPNDLAEELLGKIQEYFQAGVHLVWVVYPRQRVVHVYDTFTQVRVLAEADTVDGGQVLPGFQLPLKSLFK
jgi:Uma2 family endonuclease